MNAQNEDTLKTQVRDAYAEIATRGCCAQQNGGSENVGYTEDDLAAVPAGADLGLGCGNPQAIAELVPGESVLDLGSGAGFDCFLAARRVGDGGQVIGVDMTPEMVEKARGNARTIGAKNVEFRLGEIEQLPLASKAVDVIVSNCVINLSPDKPRVFAEAYRVLKPGGRLAISDMVQLAPPPPSIAEAAEAYIGCVTGAASAGEVERLLHEAGFEQVEVAPHGESRDVIAACMPGAEDYVASATIRAVKPRANAQ